MEQRELTKTFMMICVFVFVSRYRDPQLLFQIKHLKILDV